MHGSELVDMQEHQPCFCTRATPSDSFSSVDEEMLKELENVPVVLTTQDEMDLRDVVKGLKVHSRPPDCIKRSDKPLNTS
jgi:hypothetical protein